MSTSLLLKEPPLQILRTLAVAIGLNEAIVAQQLYFLLEDGNNGMILGDGQRWIYNTYEEWRDQFFPFWSIDTIKRTFAFLEEKFVIESCQPEGRASRRKYYRMNLGALNHLTYERLAEQGKLPPSQGTGQIASFEQGKLPPSLYTKKTAEKTRTKKTMPKVKKIYPINHNSSSTHHPISRPPLPPLTLPDEI